MGEGTGEEGRQKFHIRFEDKSMHLLLAAILKPETEKSSENVRTRDRTSRELPSFLSLPRLYKFFSVSDLVSSDRAVHIEKDLQRPVRVDLLT